VSFGDTSRRQYGGIGAMISKPELKLRIEKADRLEASGPMADRAIEFARRWHRWAAEHSKPAPPLGCSIEVVAAPRPHSGLGTGTQLGLSVARGLSAFFGVPPQDPAALAASVGRGERSAVGSYGFAQGGLLVEAGKRPQQRFSPLITRVELPDEWRFLLVLSQQEEGLSGETERNAFAGLPPVPKEVTASLCEEILLGMLPAALERDFARFSQSLYRYGHEAGMCFASRQHGAFASERIARIVTTIRELGVEGVGQSSWGPTVFALLPDEAAARALANKLQALVEPQTQVIIAEPNRTGATIEIEE
jgi:beta-RFAP synthase